MLNILHLSQTDINSDSRILKEMLAISNIDNRVCGIGVEENDGSPSTNIQNIKIYSIKLRSRKLKLIPELFKNIFLVFEITIKMFLKSISIKPDIIHCHDTPVLPLGIMLKLFTGAKIIYDAHELESNRNGLSKISGRITLFVEKISWRFVDRLIVVSPSILKWYQKNIGDKKAEIVLNSPLLTEVNKSEKSYLRNKFNIPKKSIIFIYIGILTQGRGINLIAEVFKDQSLDSHVVFLGYGDMKCELIKLSEECGNIHVHNSVSHEKVVSIAKSANVGLALIENISLSDYYCLPNKLFEYAFAEIPVLASNFPDISMVVNKYSLGKCSNLDLKSISDSIKEFELMNILPKIASIDLYSLSWKAQEEKLVQMYKEVADDIGRGK
jgi:glycosyltransferase involved in cell wall biosynthesis